MVQRIDRPWTIFHKICTSIVSKLEQTLTNEPLNIFVQIYNLNYVYSIRKMITMLL